MGVSKLAVGLILGLAATLLAAQPINGQGTSGSVGTGELRQGQQKVIPVRLNKGYVVSGKINVLQGSKVEFDLANQQITANVVKFGFVGRGDYYYVAEVDGLYNLVITNTSYGAVWGEVSFQTEPSDLSPGSTSGQKTAKWTGEGWVSTLPPPQAQAGGNSANGVLWIIATVGTLGLLAAGVALFGGSSKARRKRKSYDTIVIFRERDDDDDD